MHDGRCAGGRRPRLRRRAASPIRVMLLDGEQGGPYHAWQETSPYLKRMLGDAGIFQVDVVTAPPKGGDFTAFKPDWSKYQVVVLNYDAPDERWPDSLKASFEQYVRNGGGLVVYHAADNAFPHWKEFNLMIGVGGWRGRNEQAGPHFYYQDGKPVADTAPGNAGSHGARLPFKVVNQVTNHPITAGLPKEWMHVADELVRQPARAGREHDHPVHGVVRPRQPRHQPRRADAYGNRVRQRTRLSHYDGARLGRAQLRRLHRHLPARDGMGGHRQGHAESARRLPDRHQNQHSRGVQSASRLELSGRRAARTCPAGQISAEAIDRIPLGPGVVTLGAETVSGWQLNYWSRFSPGPAFDFPAKVPDGRRAGGSPPGVSAANNCFYNGKTPCFLWPRLRRLRAMSPSSGSKSTCSSPPPPRSSAAAPPVSARRPIPTSARSAWGCRARCRC